MILLLLDDCVILCYNLVFQHNIGVALLYDGVVLVLHVHTEPHLCICRGRNEAVYDVHHVIVVAVGTFIDGEHLLCLRCDTRLVEDAQHLVEAVVHLATETRNLHDDAIVREAVHKGVGKTFCHYLVIVVVCLVIDIQDRLFDVAHLVPENIDRHHRQGGAVLALGVDVLGTGVLHAEILSEAQCLRFHPRLLQFNEDQMERSVLLLHGRPEVDAEDRERIAADVGVLVRPHLHSHHLFF